MFILHNQDGLIVGTVNGPGKDYGELLTQHCHQWIFIEGEQHIDVHENFVDTSDTSNKQVKTRSALSIAVDKLEIAADGVDAAIISDIPAGARVTIQSDAGIEFDDVVDDGKVELSAATPTTYTVHIIPAGARYLPATVNVVAR